VEECGKVYTVRDADMAVKAIALMVDVPELEVLPEGLVEVSTKGLGL
jgi:hypothetical protein